MPIQTFEELTSAIIQPARALQTEQGEESKAIYFRLRRNNPAHDGNPQRAGNKKSFPGASDAWPIDGPQGFPVQSVVAALRGADAMPGVFTCSYLTQDEGEDGKTGFKQIQSIPLGEIDITIAPDQAAPGAGASGDGNGMTSAQQETLHGVLIGRETQFQAKEAQQLKHDQDVDTKLLNAYGKIEGLLGQIQGLVSVAENSAKNQLLIANEGGAVALNLIGTARRAASELQELQKANELLAGVHLRQVETRVLPPAAGQGPLAQTLEFFKTILMPIVEEVAPNAVRRVRGELDATLKQLQAAQAAPAPADAPAPAQGNGAAPPPAPADAPAAAQGNGAAPPPEARVVLPAKFAGLGPDALIALLEKGYAADQDKSEGGK